jgi:threonine 3-dehydrogenase
MRAIVKADREPGCRFVDDRPELPLLPGEVRIEVAAASVCGTDAAIHDSGPVLDDFAMRFPTTMGHETAGIVVEAGPMGDVAVGARVAVETHLHCGSCFFCRNGDGHNCSRVRLLGVHVDGAFAERVVVPAASCFALPDTIALEEAALMEPGGSAMHAVLRSGVSLAGSSVLVSGAGPVGLVLVQVAVALGARLVTVIEPNPLRRKMAEQYGAVPLDVSVDPREVADATTLSRGGYDVSFECSGAVPALTAALAGTRNEGTVVTVGLVKGDFPLSVTRSLITRGLTLRGSWGRSLWTTWDRLCELMISGRVDLAGMVTHRLPLSGLPLALELMREDAGKVLLLPSLPDRLVDVDGHAEVAGR